MTKYIINGSTERLGHVTLSWCPPPCALCPYSVTGLLLNSNKTACNVLLYPAIYSECTLFVLSGVLSTLVQLFGLHLFDSNYCAVRDYPDQ